MSSRFGVPEHGLRTAIPPVYERRPLAVVRVSLGSVQRAVRKKYEGVIDSGIDDD